MATSSARFLPRADLIIVLSANGIVEGQASFPELKAAGNNATRILHSIEAKSGDDSISLSGPRENLKTARKSHNVESNSKADDKISDTTRQNGDFGIYKYYFACISRTVVAVFFLLQFAYAFLCTFPSR
jgi:ATP-binding cassette subfamily C (CFTR/MRP) protein 1